MIREAVAGDAEAIAGVQHRAWWRAYAEWVDPERFGTLEQRVERWAELLVTPTGTTVVADVAGRVAGFASVGPARDADLGGGVGELWALYVDPPAQGAGVGGGLLDAAQARLRADGLGAAVLWVLAVNAPARELYARRGWRLDTEDAALRAATEWWAPAVRYRVAL